MIGQPWHFLMIAELEVVMMQLMHKVLFTIDKSLVSVIRLSFNGLFELTLGTCVVIKKNAREGDR